MNNFTQPIQRHLDTVAIRSPRAVLNWVVPAQSWRHFAQLILVSSGRVRAVLRDSYIELGPSDVAWLPPGLMVEAEFGAGTQADLVTVSEEWLIPAVAHTPGTDVPLRDIPETIHTVSLHDERYRQQIQSSIESLRFELLENGAGAAVIVAAEFTSLLTYLYRLVDTDLLRKPTGLANSVVYQRFLQLVELRFREHWTVGQYADYMGVTSRRLETATGRGAGESPGVMIQRKLVNEACQRLAYSPLSVSEVAYGLGFRDPAYFNRFFRKKTGKTPGAWRREIWAKEQAAVDESFAAWP